MTTSSTARLSSTRPPGWLAAWVGGAWALAAGLMLGGLRFAFSEPPLRRAEALGDLAFTLALTLPFLLAILATRWPNAVARAAVWSLATLAALAGSLVAFSGISLVMLPAAPVLAIAAVRSLLRAGPRGAALAVASAVVLLVLHLFAFSALFLRDDPACWERRRTPEGQVWVQVPFRQTMPVDPSADKSFCNSDTFTALEGAASLALLGAEAAIVLRLGRRA